MKLGMQVGLVPGHIVLDGDPSPPSQKGGGAPNVWPISDWIKMPLGMKVSLDPGDFVLDGDPAPVDRNDIVFSGDPALPPPPEKKAQTTPTFWPIYIVGKLLDGSRCHLVQR